MSRNTPASSPLRPDSMIKQLEDITALVEEIAVENGCLGICESLSAATDKKDGAEAHASALKVARDMAQRTRVLDNEVGRLLSSLKLV